MTKKRTFQDPDFGAIEVPDDQFPTKQEWEERRAKLLPRLRAHRLWETGKVYECPRCRRKALLGRDDLVEEVVRPGHVQSFRHLQGARCVACDAQFLEPAEIVDMENEVGAGLVPDFEAKVSNIGSGTLGTYWPKDVVRNMGLTPGKRALIKVLDRDTALVTFTRGTKKK